MNKETLIVASSANERFALGLIVLLCSIVLNNRVPRIRFYIIDDQILPETKGFMINKLNALAEIRGVELQIKFFELSSIPMPDMPSLNGSYSTYARLFFPILFDDLSIFYVDSDIVCNRSFPTLKEMETQHGGQLMAACEDNPLSAKSDQVWSGKFGGGAYLNSGFLWMNLRLMREVDLVKQVCDHEEVLEGIRVSTAHFRDQTLLNCLCHGRWGVLPGNFNRVGASLHTGAQLSFDDNWHFTGEFKPWLVDGSIRHLTVPFYLYHTLLKKLGMESLLPYAEPYLPLSAAKYGMRYLISVRLWFRSRKRFSRFQDDVKIYQYSKAAADAYEIRIDSLLMK